MNNRATQEPVMDYEAFKKALQEKIQALVDKSINFIETESVGINETLEGLILKLDGENAAPIIYPEKLYDDYRAGIPLSMIAASMADTVNETYEYPAILELTLENAQNCIRFALINKDRNRKLLETCPYKEVLDLAAIPRWYTDRGSFLVDHDKALTKAQPKDLDASEIEVRLGATWVDRSYIQQFMVETLDTPVYLQKKIIVNFFQNGNVADWFIANKNAIPDNNVMAYTTYGTGRISAYRILEDSLNLRDVRIYDTITDAGRTGAFHS